MRAREIAELGVLTAVLLLGQVAFAFLPNIEVVSLLIIIYTRVYRKKVFFIIYAFVILEGCLYGFGLWWFMYLYSWSILAILALVFRKQESLFFWSLLSGAFGLSFGFLCSIPTLFLSGPHAAVAYWIAGIPFDISHCAGNAVLAFLLFRPLRALLFRISSKPEP